MNNESVKNRERSILDFLRVMDKLEREVSCEAELEREQDRELERFSGELILLVLEKGYVKIDEGGMCPSTFRLTKKGEKYLEKSRMSEENQSRYHY